MNIRSSAFLALVAAVAGAVHLSTSCNATHRQASHIAVDVTEAAAGTTPDRPTGNSRTLELLSYNAFLRPGPVGWGDANGCRAREIGEQIADRAASLDLVVLNETFDLQAVERLVDEVDARFPYRSLRKPEGGFLSTNGGLSILSKYPIRELYSERFDSCSSWGDCLASKGFLHAVVEVSSTLRVNVLATHLDAGAGAESPTTRLRQVGAIRDYVERHDVGDDWPTMLLGDLNVDGLSAVADRLDFLRPSGTEYRRMMSILDGLRRPVDAVRRAFGNKPVFGSGRGRLGSMNCRGQSLVPCSDPGGAEGSFGPRLDYVLRLRVLDPNRAGARLLDAEHLAFRNDSCDTRYLSDHRAVHARMKLRPYASGTSRPPAR